MNRTRSLTTLLTLSAIATTPLAGMNLLKVAARSTRALAPKVASSHLCTNPNLSRQTYRSMSVKPTAEYKYEYSGNEEKRSRSSFWKKALIGGGLAALGGAYWYYQSHQLSDYEKEILTHWTATEAFGRNSICSCDLLFVFGQMRKTPTLEAKVLESLKKRFQEACSTYLGERDQLFLIAACQYAPEFAIELTTTIAQTLADSFFKYNSLGRKWNVDSMKILTDAVISSAKPSPVTIAVFDKKEHEFYFKDVYLPSKYKNDEQRKRLETTATCLALIQASIAKIANAFELEVQKRREDASKVGIKDFDNEMAASWRKHNAKAMTALQALATKCATEQEKLKKESAS